MYIDQELFKSVWSPSVAAHYYQRMYMIQLEADIITFRVMNSEIIIPV